MCGGKDWVVLPLSRCTCMHSRSFHSSDLELAKSFRTPRTTFGVKIRSMVVSTKMRILWVNKMWFFSQNTKDFNVWFSWAVLSQTYINQTLLSVRTPWKEMTLTRVSGRSRLEDTKWRVTLYTPFPQQAFTALPSTQSLVNARQTL